MLDRRKFLGRTAVATATTVGLEWVAPSVLTTSALADPSGPLPPPNPPVPELLGQHPFAAAQPTDWGRRLQDLVVFDGIVFAGYGDWNANTGPIRAGGWSISAGDWTFEATLDTESTWLYRRVGNRLVVPFIDPRNNTADLAVRSLGSPTWTPLAIGIPGNPATAGTLHALDVATFDGTDLWVAGARRNTLDGTVWRSPSGNGGDWVESLVVAPVGPPGSYARATTLVRYGGRLLTTSYSVTDGNPPTVTVFAGQAFDGASWVAAPEYTFDAALPGHRRGHAPVVFDGKVLRLRTWPFLPDPFEVMIFDGTTLTVGPQLSFDITVDEQGRLWRLDSDLVVRRVSPGSPTEEVVVTAPAGSSCLAVSGSTLYLGTAGSELYRVTPV